MSTSNDINNLICAVQHGNINKVKQLAILVGGFECRLGLNQAVLDNNMDCVKVLAPHVNLSHLDPELWTSDAQILNVLVAHSNPDHIEHCLVDSVIHNHIHAVRFLVGHFDCTNENSFLLQLASCHHREEIFDLLYPLSDPHAALQQLIDDYQTEIHNIPEEKFNEDVFLIRQRLEMERLNATLLDEVGDNNNSETHPRRKM